MDLDHIINWRRHDARITSSGQPSEAELGEIAALGVRTIINLAPHHNKGSLEDEQASVTAHGITYIHIPVEFENPTDGDFTAFCDAMNEAAVYPLHVHCIYNARVSAFFYKRARSGLGGDIEAAGARMESIWRPGNVWAAFIERHDDVDKPHRYAGDDY
ncbi:MAG: protein tyrosine phosphatase family protein [Pseudomonadota bacterium]